MIFIPEPVTAANEGIDVEAVLQDVPPSVEYWYSIEQPIPSLPPVAGPARVTVVPSQTLAEAGDAVAVVGAVGCGKPSHEAIVPQGEVEQPA